MVSDYYSLLGVSPSADLATIRQAYRKHASICHPDHGGSHAKMLKINEAWYFLSDSERRARYDETLQQPNSEAAASFYREDLPEAERQAKEYPRDWNQFEDWLDIVAADFSQARYGKVAGAWMTSWPTAHESLSGWLFIAGGGGMGVLLGFALLIARIPHRQGGSFWYMLLMGCTLFACGGAWVGRWLHEVMRDIMQPAKPLAPKTRSSSVTKSDSCVVRCPHCQQQLKLPRVPHILSVTCRKCRGRFELPPSIVS